MLPLLSFLSKFIDFEKEFLFTCSIEFKARYCKRINTIQNIYRHQKNHFKTGKKIKDRIVSVHKDYIGSIVRGKEIRAALFGAKVNKVHIDGVSFIEYLNFNAFHEGNHFVQIIEKHQFLTRKRTLIAGIDKIYTTNKNRTYTSSKKIN